MKLWGGRFQKETDQLVNDFNSSIRFDARLYKEDITGSMAHAQMLGGQRHHLQERRGEAIEAGLKGILADIEAGKVEFTADNEDIHMNVEALLTAAHRRRGQAAPHRPLPERPGGRGLPAVRPAGDPRDHRPAAGPGDGALPAGEGAPDAVMPGYTHLQRAQPITFAQHLMAYATMFRRDVTRLEDCRSGWTSAPWAPAPWRAPPTPSTGCRRPRPWALTAPMTTPWTASPTGTTPWSC